MTFLGERIQELVGPNDTVLDLGCGIMMHTREGFKCKSVLGVDGCRAYLYEISPDFPVIHHNITNLDMFLTQSFDVVLLIDVVEHLKHEDAINLLNTVKGIARKKVIGLTPKEFVENHESAKNAWGMGENELQEHLSLVNHEDLVRAGYSVDTFEKGHLFTWKK